MTPDELTERMTRVLKTCANIKQALTFIENEANVVITEMRNVNQMQLWGDDGDNPNVTVIST